MSKTIYIKILLLFALAISAACEKERDIPSPAQEGGGRQGVSGK